MTVPYLLAAMWALGLAGAAVYMCFSMCETVMGRLVFAFIAVPLWVIMGLGPSAMIKHKSGPELATLLKSEWQCAASHQEQYTTFIAAGKTQVPVQNTMTVCDVYTRRMD